MKANWSKVCPWEPHPCWEDRWVNFPGYKNRDSLYSIVTDCCCCCSSYCSTSACPNPLVFFTTCSIVPVKWLLVLRRDMVTGVSEWAMTPGNGRPRPPRRFWETVKESAVTGNKKPVVWKRITQPMAAVLRNESMVPKSPRATKTTTKKAFSKTTGFSEMNWQKAVRWVNAMCENVWQCQMSYWPTPLCSANHPSPTVLLYPWESWN